MKRIEICGGIASGKTTLASILKQLDYNVVFERFMDNPFLNEFYTSNGSDNTFETEMVFLLLHYNLLKERKTNQITVCDYSFFQDYSYAVNNLKTTEMLYFKEIYSYLINRVDEADIIIYLKCDVNILLRRIYFRNRQMEKSITKKYLTDTIYNLEEILKGRENVIVIESDRYDFRNKDRQYVVDIIKEGIRDLR